MNCIFCKSSDLLKRNIKNKKFISSNEKNIFKKKNIQIIFCKKCLLIQKKIDRDYKSTIKKIYFSYHNSDKLEINKVYNKNYKTRNHFVIQTILKKFSKKIKKIKILDFGAGKCNLINGIDKNYSKYKYFAFDLKKPKNIYNKNITPEKYFEENIDNIYGRFDVIVLQHSFEHLLSPVETIKKLLKFLNKGGFIYIQSPEIYQKKLDLYTYDHVFHLSNSSASNLSVILKKKIEIKNDYKNEISLFVFNKKNTIKKFNKSSSFEIFDFDIFQKKIINKKNLSIFSAAGSSFVLAKNLNSKIKFYLDDDERKIGNFFFNLVVKKISPKLIKKSEIIVINSSHFLTNKFLRKAKTILI